MIIPITIISIIILILVIGLLDEEFFTLLALMGTVICIAAIIFLTSSVVGQRTVDQEIEMYQEENMNIETKVKETVRAYMNYEESTYKQLVENADLTTLVIKYPELNSNELIKTEINLYVENNNKIKALKEEKINITIYKWWLYFGK